MKRTSTSRERAVLLLRDLRSKIEDGSFVPGSLLPSENCLCADYQLSRPTVRRALEKLSHLQLIEKKPGVGTFVKDANEALPLPIFRIGVDFFFSTDYYYKRIWTGLNNSHFGKNCYFHFLDKEKLLHGILDSDVDGIILCGFDEAPSVLEKLKSSGKPLIVINRCIENPADTAYVTVDHRKEMAFAVTHLFRYGEKKVAFVGDDQASGSIQMRHAGWMDAYRQQGIEPPEDLQIKAAAYMQPDFYGKLQQFIIKNDFPALVFPNASIYMRFCPDLCRIANQLQQQPRIVVFDDVSTLPEIQSVPCSYVQMPLENFGAIAVEFLRQKKAQPNLPPVQKIFPCNLVLRQLGDAGKTITSGIETAALQQKSQQMQNITEQAKSVTAEFSAANKFV